MKKFDWHLIYTKANQELIAKNNLEQQGLKTFLPLIERIDNKHNKSPKQIIMFPRYLFVQIKKREINWNKIRFTRGVSHIVTFQNDKITVVPLDVMKSLVSITGKNGILKETVITSPYQQGDELIVKDGILKGTEGVFISRKSKERVEILLEMINRKITANIPESYLEYKN